MPQATCDIGLIGLAVMGQNLVLNMNDHGYKVAVFQPDRLESRRFHQQRSQGHAGGRRALHRRAGRPAEAPAPRHADGQGRPHGRRDDRPACAASRSGRHHHRRRQLALSRHHPPHRKSWRPKASSTSAPAFPAAKRARAAARPSCPAATPPPGRTSKRFSRPSPPRSKTALRAASGSARTARATT